jgi:molybdate transport system substrate-binding protein
LTFARLEVVGPFPKEVQREVVYATSIGANSKEADVAGAFMAHLMSPTSAAVIKATGMPPGP